MSDYTAAQSEMLGMIREGAEAARTSFDRLDAKAQDVMTIGALILVLVGIATVSPDQHPTKTALTVAAAACFAGLVLTASWARRLRTLSDAPLSMKDEVWAEWEVLEGRDLWAQTMAQYRHIITRHGEASADKARWLKIANGLLIGELVCIAAAVLIPWA